MFLKLLKNIAKRVILFSTGESVSFIGAYLSKSNLIPILGE